MNRMILRLFCAIMTSFPLFVSAQFFVKPVYPVGYFRNPLDIPIQLSGNFGELRPNHYHMGLDFKTEKRENLRVYAAADGYISRIKIEAGGFGRAIYIDHPNGYTTLYCHLNDFYPELEQWVRKQQYDQEQWQITLEPPASMFPVKKGSFLAYSGNTGGSQAPHLHFEIRRTLDDVNLNPQLFGFQIPDNTKPTILRLGVYDRNFSTYAQAPQLIGVKQQGGYYTTSSGLVSTSSDKVSFAITTYDTQSGSSNLNGIYEGELWVDEQPIVGFRMDEISYNHTRYMNAHIDYRTKLSGGPYLQHYAELPGFLYSIYQKKGGDGVIDLSDRKVHAIRLVSRDAAGNAAEMRFQIQYNGAAQKAQGTERQYLPMMMEVYESDEMEFFLGERCLYDRTPIRVEKKAAVDAAAASALFVIGASTTPLQDSMVVRIKTNRALSPEEKKKVVMRRRTGAKMSVQSVQWQQGWASARFRDFGNFDLVVDREPPSFTLIGFGDGYTIQAGKRLMITVKDNMDRWKNFRATVDGKWLRCTNDKGKTYIYTVDEKFPVGEHILSLSVEDEAGNIAQKQIRLVRQ